MHESIIELQQFYAEFETEFQLFFEELQEHCRKKLAEI
jgi:acyl carrier protein phosphodiesterase